MNPLADCGLPRFFALAGQSAVRLDVPEPRGGETVRFVGRSLAGMQKEGLVRTSGGGAWRLASDEGAYLDGLDEAPCPLAFMTTGMVACFMGSIQARLSAAGVVHRGVRLVQDNFYTMEGSMPRRTMIGGAKPVEIEVEIAADVDADTLRPMVIEAVEAAAVSGLIRPILTNTFTLSVNGRELRPQTVSPFGPGPLPDPKPLFEDLSPAGALREPLVTRAGLTPLTEEATSHSGSSYAPEQSRTLHLRGICTVRPNGVTLVEQQLYNPHGSIFRLLSHESAAGRDGLAPDPLAYVSAGIGFCFMTQFGRFARIMGKRLDGYRIVQDTRFTSGHADAVETHVYLDTPEDDAFAREVLDLGERTCFLHALCRTPLETHVRVSTRSDLAGEWLGPAAND